VRRSEGAEGCVHNRLIVAWEAPPIPPNKDNQQLGQDTLARIETQLCRMAVVIFLTGWSLEDTDSVGCCWLFSLLNAPLIQGAMNRCTPSSALPTLVTSHHCSTFMLNQATTSPAGFPSCMPPLSFPQSYMSAQAHATTTGPHPRLPQQLVCPRLSSAATAAECASCTVLGA
jgi:hypothetical protein